MENNALYDAVIVGGGHNGLVAACYLARAGLSVLILEKNAYMGGATQSKLVFPGVDARVSVYSYLISLLPKKILSDLDIHLEMRQRAIASYTPHEKHGKPSGLLISNVSEAITRQSFLAYYTNYREYQRYQNLQEMLQRFAQRIWPTLLKPLQSKQNLRDQFQAEEERTAWDYLVEKPLAALIEETLSEDLVRGAVFTDAKIGVSTFPEDPTLLQNRTFLYHIIGQGSGEWRVPVGGMGALVDALLERANSLGVRIQKSAQVVNVDHGLPSSVVSYLEDGKERSVKARFVLFNTASDIVNRCLPGAYAEEQVEGSVFKVNMVLKKLPTMKDSRVSAVDAFTGTLHLNESYQHMTAAFENARDGHIMDALPGEMYCHSLTDPSILSPDLQEQGFHTLTLFGLDVPYAWFVEDNARTKEEVTRNYLQSINQVIKEDIHDLLAVDTQGSACIEAKSPLDLEESLGLPRGNIFHGNLTWPFAENTKEAGAWGVETNFENVLICGSSAKRGGAVSGIPGHNAAMKIIGRSG